MESGIGCAVPGCSSLGGRSDSMGEAVGITSSEASSAGLVEKKIMTLHLQLPHANHSGGDTQRRLVK